MSRRLRILAAWAIALGATVALPLPAQTTPEPLRFRRVEAPADFVPPAESGRFLPIERDEFERLLAASQAESTAIPPARIEEALHECRFAEPRWLRGETRLRVIAEGAASVVWLDPCNLAIRSLVWSEGDASPTVGRAADGRIGLVADRSGELRIDWSLAGVELPSGAVAFNLELPDAPVSRLSADASDGWRVEWRGPASSLPDPQGRGWRLSEPRAALRVAPANPPATDPTIAWREKNLYDLSNHGWSLAAEWTLDVPGEPLSSLTVEVDPPLRLVAAQYGETDLPRFAQTDSAGRRVVRLALPKPLEGSNRLLLLRAIADRPWRPGDVAPRLRPRDALWQQGESTLRVSDPALCVFADVTDGRLLRTSPLAVTDRGELWELQHFTPDWGLAPRAARPRSAPRRAGVTLSCGPKRIHALAQLEFEGPEGWSAILAPEWRILRVESDAGEALAWRQVEDRGGNRLEVDARVGAEPEANRVRIEAERPPATLGLADFRLLKFDDLPREGLVAVAPAEGATLSVRGDEGVEWVPVASLDAQRAALVRALPTAWIADAALLPDTVQIEPRPADPSRSIARWIATARCGSQGVEARYDVEVRGLPLAARRLDIRLDPPADGELVWFLGETRSQALLAARLPSAPGETAETWRIELPEDCFGFCRLIGQRRHEGPQVALPLPRVSEAVSLGGEVRIAASSTADVRIAAEGLEPLPQVDAEAAWIARFGCPGGESERPRVTIRQNAAPERLVLAYERGVLSIGADGAAETRYEWKVDGRQTRALPLALPDGVVCVSASVDGSPVRSKIEGRSVVVPLPDRAACLVEVALRESAASRRPWRRLAPLPVTLSGVVARRAWRIELPSSWRAVHPQAIPVSDATRLEPALALAGEAPPSVWIVKRDFLLALVALSALAGFLITLGSRGWMARAALVIGLGVAMLLLLPPLLASLPIAFLGGCLAAWVRRAWSALAGLRSGTGAITTAAAVAAAITFHASAQENNPAPRQTYEVYSFADPASPLLVPEPLWAALRAAESASQAAPSGIWVERARYRGELVWSGGAPRLALSAELRVHAFDGPSWLALPWPPEAVAAARVTLDGLPVETASDAEAFRVHLPEAGAYDLVVPLDVDAQSFADGGAADVAISQAATSTLELRVSPDLHVEAPTARGHVERLDGGARLIADLGAAARLALRWSTEPHGDGAPQVEADQWLLLEVRPGAVLLRTKLAYHVRSGALAELRFTVDPRLRWLPLTQSGVSAASLAPSALDPTAATVPLVSPVRGDWNFQASLLLTGHSGIGQLGLPRLEPRGVAVRRRCLAVAIDSTLVGEIDASLPRVPVAEFEQAWGERLPASADVFELSTDLALQPRVRTRPAEPRPHVDQTVRYFLDRPQARFQWTARWPTGEAPPASCMIEVPEGAVIDSVELHADGFSRELNAARIDNQRIGVVLGGAVRAGELRLRGRWDLPEGESSLPALKLSGSGAPRVEIWRSSRVRVTPWENPDRQQPELGAAWLGNWRRVAQWTSDLDSPYPMPLDRIEITSLDGRPKLSQALHVPDDAAGPARLVVRLDEAPLGADRIEWDAPPGWHGELTCEPPGEAEWIERPDGRRVLRVSFARPLAAGQVARIDGLRPPNDRWQEVPVLRPRNADAARSLAVFREAAIDSWGVDSEAREALPPELAWGGASAGFRLSDAPLRRRAEAAAPRAARALAAEYRLRIADTRRWYGQMKWIVEPRGAADVDIELPGGASLVGALVDGRFVDGAPSGERRWRLSLASRELPQTVEVLLEGEVPAGGATFFPSAPRMLAGGEPPVVWRIASHSVEIDPSGGQRLRPGEAALRRWQRGVEALSAISAAPSVFGRAELSAWFQVWKSRFRAAESEAAALPSTQRQAVVQAETQLWSRWPNLEPADGTVARPEVDFFDADRAADFELPPGKSLAIRWRSVARPWPRALLALGSALAGLACAWRFRRPAEPAAT